MSVIVSLYTFIKGSY